MIRWRHRDINLNTMAMMVEDGYVSFVRLYGVPGDGGASLSFRLE